MNTQNLVFFPQGGKTSDCYCNTCGAMYNDNMRICENEKCEYVLSVEKQESENN